MGKSARKRVKKPIQSKRAKRSGETDKDQTKAAEFVSCLLELHKLQGGLLNQLDKEIK